MKQVQCDDCECVMDMVGSYVSEREVETGKSRGSISPGTNFSIGSLLSKPTFRVGRSSSRSTYRTFHKTVKVYTCEDCARIWYQKYGQLPGTLIVNKSKSVQAALNMVQDTPESFVQLNHTFKTAPAPIQRGILENRIKTSEEIKQAQVHAWASAELAKVQAKIAARDAPKPKPVQQQYAKVEVVQRSKPKEFNWLGTLIMAGIILSVLHSFHII